MTNQKREETLAFALLLLFGYSNAFREKLTWSAHTHTQNMLNLKPHAACLMGFRKGVIGTPSIYQNADRFSISKCRQAQFIKCRQVRFIKCRVLPLCLWRRSERALFLSRFRLSDFMDTCRGVLSNSNMEMHTASKARKLLKTKSFLHHSRISSVNTSLISFFPKEAALWNVEFHNNIHIILNIIIQFIIHQYR